MTKRQDTYRKLLSLAQAAHTEIDTLWSMPDDDDWGSEEDDVFFRLGYARSRQQTALWQINQLLAALKTLLATD